MSTAVSATEKKISKIFASNTFHSMSLSGGSLDFQVCTDLLVMRQKKKKKPLVIEDEKEMVFMQSTIF